MIPTATPMTEVDMMRYSLRLGRSYRRWYWTVRLMDARKNQPNRSLREEMRAYKREQGYLYPEDMGGL